MCTLLQKNPELGERAKRVSNTVIRFATGTTIKAIASEYAGAAGSNHGLTLWDEIWAGTHEHLRAREDLDHEPDGSDESPEAVADGRVVDDDKDDGRSRRHRIPGRTK
jgi:hypothetical protein